MTNPFKEAWDKALAHPSGEEMLFTGVKRYPYAGFRKSALAGDPSLAKEFVTAISGGKIVVLDDAFSRDEVMEIKDLCLRFKESTPDSPGQRITSNCPDYHQIFDSSMSPTNGYEAIDRSYYFFPWNGDSFGLIAKVKHHWDLSKILNGFSPNCFTSNRPEDGIVDRLHIKHYPAGAGRISTHRDPVVALQMISSIHITQQGIDYSEGSYYALDANGERHYLDPLLKSGCMVMFHPQIPHGVTTVDPGTPVDWDSPAGRWFILLFNPQSHLISNRKTALSVEG